MLRELFKSPTPNEVALMITDTIIFSTMSPGPRVFRISGTCNNYPWGKKGSDSLAARLCKASDENFDIKEDEPYSEIWFGDYPDFPAKVLATGELLSDALNENRLALLGSNVVRNLDSQLPFLPKVRAFPTKTPWGTQSLTCLGPLHRESAPPAASPRQAPRGEPSHAGSAQVYRSEPQARNRGRVVKVRSLRGVEGAVGYLVGL